jgi:hypothetical protein
MSIIIYGIFCITTRNVYYGSTIKTLDKRIKSHISSYGRYLKGKTNYTTSFNIIKNNNYIFKVMELCNINNRYKRENFYITTFPCVNKCIPTRNDSDYYKDNKERIVEGVRKYRTENKVKIKIYREKNKERRAQNWKKYYCDNKEKLIQKNKDYIKKNKEKNKEKKKENDKEYYRINREKILERNNQIVSCECGVNYTHSNKSRHEKTQIHQNYKNLVLE